MRHALKASLLDDVNRLESPLGVVSVYAGVDHADPDRVRIELKNECARIEAERVEDGSVEALRDALEVIGGGVQDALLGRFAVAGFVPIGSSNVDAIWVDLPEVASTTVVLDTSAYALPLLPMIARFATSGVVTVARDQIALYQWAHGGLEELERRAVDVDTATWRDTDGPFNAVAAGASSGGAATGVKSTIGSNDAYADKLEGALIAELASIAAPLIARRADERSWERLVWFGNPAIVDSVREAMGDTRITHVVADDAQVLSLSRDQLLERVRDVCEQRWTRDGGATIRALAERRPAERVENVEEARTLAREGRVGELFVIVPDALVVDDDHRHINALIGDVARHGGQVRALPATATDDPATTRVVATLRW